MLAKKATILRLNAEQRARLEQLAKKLERPRMQLIREAIEALLARYERRGS